MEIIRSWEFNQRLSARNIVIIVKLYYDYMKKQGIPTLDTMLMGVDSMNRQIIAENNPELTQEQIDDEFENHFIGGDFACMDRYIESILSKCGGAFFSDNEYVADDDEENIIAYIFNDCQNIFDERLLTENGAFSAGHGLMALYKRPNNVLMLGGE